MPHPGHSIGDIPNAHGGLCLPGPPLLSLYPGVRQTGWAALTSNRKAHPDRPMIAASGIAGQKARRKVEPALRISCLLEALTKIADDWRPYCIVISEASGLSRQSPGRAELDEALRAWADALGLPSVYYPALEVRAAIAGRSNAPKEALAHAVMVRLMLIGQSRSPIEWEAVAAGCYHLDLSALRRTRPDQSRC